MNLTEVLPRFFEEPGGHVVFDPDLRVCEVGPEFLRITKHERSNVMGMHYSNILTEPNPRRHAEMLESVRAGVAIVIKTGSTAKLPVIRCDVVPGDGSKPEEKWWRVALVPIKNEAGVVSWVVGRFEDVSVEMIASHKIDRLRRSNYTLYALAVITMGLIALGIRSNNNKVGTVSQRTCQVQSNYLTSTRPLSRVMSDINALLLAPQPARAPRQSSVARGIIKNMETDLHSYLKITGNLPPSRSKC